MTGNEPKTRKELTQDNVTAKHNVFFISNITEQGQDVTIQRESRILHVDRLMSFSQ
jgi:hypothetical protein